MSKRALLWSIAAAMMAFFYLAASYSGPGACTTLDFTKWAIYTCEVLPRLAVLLVGIVPALVLVYFAEKGTPRLTDLVGGHVVSWNRNIGLWLCSVRGCGFKSATRVGARSHAIQTGAKPRAAAPTERAHGFGANATAQSPGSTPPAGVQEIAAPPATAPSEFKTCPDCAEQVRNAARKCRFCGYMFEPATTP